MKGIHWSQVDSPHKVPGMWGFDVFFVVSLQSCWINSYVISSNLRQYDTTEDCISTAWVNLGPILQYQMNNISKRIPMCTCHGRGQTIPREQSSWGQHGAHLGIDRTQVGPMLAPWTLLSGNTTFYFTSTRLSKSWHIPRHHFVKVPSQ